MESNVLFLIIGFAGAWFWFRFNIEKKIVFIFERFKNEVHNQYLFLLDKHGVTLPREAEEELNAWKKENGYHNIY